MGTGGLRTHALTQPLHGSKGGRILGVHRKETSKAGIKVHGV